MDHITTRPGSTTHQPDPTTMAHAPSPVQPVVQSPATAGSAGPAAAAIADPARLVERTIAVLAVFALGVRIPIAQGVTPGYLIAIALLPVWYGSVRRYYGGRWIFWLALACIPFALFLVQLNSVGHTFAASVFVGQSVLVVGFICGLGLFLWAQRIVTRGLIGAAFGAGMLVGELVQPGDLTATNPLKFAVALPASIIVLSLLEGSRHVGRQLVAVLALGIGGALVDARSFFAICLLTAVLVGWQMRPRTSKRSASWGWTVLLIASAGAVVYYLGTTLAVDGYLGEQTQQRSIAQIDASGSLLLGGRPELGATAALVERMPWGFGAGTVPNLTDINTAKTGMAALGYDPNNGYVERYMFGTGINLHSVVGDTWAAFGILGVLLALSILYLMVRGAATRIAQRQASALTILLASYGLWNTFFSPFYSSLPMLTFGLAYLLLPITGKDRASNASRPAAEPASVHIRGFGD